jgi:hypothetical protein
MGFELLAGEGLNLRVEGDEDCIVADGEAEQQSVCDLAMAVDTRNERTYELKPTTIHGE